MRAILTGLFLSLLVAVAQAPLAVASYTGPAVGNHYGNYLDIDCEAPAVFAIDASSNGGNIAGVSACVFLPDSYEAGQCSDSGSSIVCSWASSSATSVMIIDIVAKTWYYEYVGSWTDLVEGFIV